MKQSTIHLLRTCALVSHLFLGAALVSALDNEEFETSSAPNETADSATTSTASTATPAVKESGPGFATVETITVLGSGSDGGTLGGEDLKDLPLASMVVNREEIDRIKFVDHDEFLDRIPGESLVRNLRIPQGGKSYTAPLVDGLPLGSPYRGATSDIADVNSFDVERVEIIKGPASALYPNNTLGGTINLVTRIPPSESEFRLWSEAGNDDRTRLGAHATGTVGKVGYFLDANYLSTDGFRETFKNDRNQFSGKLVYSASDRTQIHLRGEQVGREEVFPGDLRQNEFDTDPSQVGRTSGSSEEIDSLLLSFRLEHRIGDRGDLYLGFVTRNEESEGVSRFQGPNASELDDTTFKATYSHQFDPMDTQVIVGFDRFEGTEDFRAFDLDADGHLSDVVNASADSGVDINSLFAQVSFSPHEDVTIRLGVRDEEVTLDSLDRLTGVALEKEFSKTAPKFGVVYQATDRVQVWGGYSEGFLTPDLDELFTDREANPDLLPEEGRNMEIGIRGWVGNLRYESSLYNTDITNFIVTEEFFTDDGNDFLNFTNAGEVNVRGLETVIEYRFSQRFSLGLTHTYARNVFETFFRNGTDLSGNRLSRSPEHHWNLRAAVFPIERLAIELEVDDLSGYYANDDNASDPDGKFDRDPRINLRATYTFGDWEIWLTGLNLTETLEDRVSFSRGSRRYRVINGRQIYAGFGYRF